MFFRDEINKIIKGKEFNIKPFEKYIQNGKTQEKTMKIQIIGKLGASSQN